MIVDASALIAIIRDEPDAEAFIDALAADTAPQMSAANYLEAAIVVDATRDPVARRRFDELLQVMSLEIVPVSVDQAHVARSAYRDFGKGSGHAARLNFGDCFAYALAMESGKPLLFKGDDFGHTDATPALPPVG
ncbi:type II toxin-antitoxin system VapC family toxin [Blastococcus saxobsidens]|uniref:Ribonuclease VapC n=1 Tax=Blastococcus saxobsidens (strain DD2) TaxID=1146883 RepID=H6RSW3_BLASD|nr:type II toxin-antitoxin system VapC family toxin [Blastococcus saxobsidens]CCG03066.1 putative pilT protein, N-terminal, putative toxin of TAS system [Blastococcus saxobsidens DD2]